MTGREKDNQLYDLVKGAINLSPSEWVFIILNRDNEKYGDKKYDDLLDDFEDGVSLKKMVVRQTIIADCSNHESVNKILQVVLSYLRDNIRRLDKAYAISQQDEILKIQQALDSTIDFAASAFDEIVPQGDTEILDDAIDKIWEDLTLKLDELVDEYKERRWLNNVDFENACKEALRLCRNPDEHVPSADNLMRDRGPSEYWRKVHADAQTTIRVSLTQQFRDLDKTLQEIIKKAKSDVAHIFINHGKLGMLISAVGIDFIEYIINSTPAQYKIIREAFRELKDFELNYRGFIQYRIRRHLDLLDADRAGEVIPNLDSPKVKEVYRKMKGLPDDEKLNRNAIGLDIVRSDLLVRHAKTVYRLEAALEALLQEPNEVVFGIIEDFKDQAIRYKNSERQWKKFYRRYAATIWPEKISDEIKILECKNRWTTAVERVKRANQSNFRFIV